MLIKVGSPQLAAQFVARDHTERTARPTCLQLAEMTKERQTGRNHQPLLCCRLMHANLRQRLVALLLVVEILEVEVKVLEFEVDVEVQSCASFLLGPATGQRR